MSIEKCPTCAAPVRSRWNGLELVANGGDETLATKYYKFAPELAITQKEGEMIVTIVYHDGRVFHQLAPDFRVGFHGVGQQLKEYIEQTRSSLKFAYNEIGGCRCSIKFSFEE